MDKILKIQTEIGVLSKTETNPFFKSKYMDINGLLAQLLPLLAKYGLTVIQPLSNIGVDAPALATEIFDGDKKIFSSAIQLPNLQDPQKMGSAITYYRRYALQSLFLLQAQDDDGNHASGEKTVQLEPTYTKPMNRKEVKEHNNKAVEEFNNNQEPF